MLLHAEPNVILKLFQHDPDYVSQTAITTECRLQFLFLAAMHRIHVPSIMCSFTRDWTDSRRDPNKILKECKDALLPELLAQLKWFLCHCNPTKSIGRIREFQRMQSRVCVNHTSFSKKKLKQRLPWTRRSAKMRSSISALARLLPSLVSHPTRFDLQRMKKRLSRVWQIISIDTIFHLYEQIRLNHRRDWTVLRVSHH